MYYVEKSHLAIIDKEMWEVEDGDELERNRAREFVEIIKGNIKEFDIDIFYRMIEKMTVFEDKIIVGFLDGTEVESIIEQI